MPATTDAPRMARRLMAVHTASFPEAVRHDAEIVISELVTNALTHGQPAITVELTTSTTGVHVAVHDTSPTLPELPAHVPDPAHATGRGLLIIDALSSGWGITATEDAPGKTVWCELSAPAPVISSGQAPSLVPLEPAQQAPGALAGP